MKREMVDLFTVQPGPDKKGTRGKIDLAICLLACKVKGERGASSRASDCRERRGRKKKHFASVCSWETQVLGGERGEGMERLNEHQLPQHQTWVTNRGHTALRERHGSPTRVHRLVQSNSDWTSQCHYSPINIRGVKVIFRCLVFPSLTNPT